MVCCLEKTNSRDINPIHFVESGTGFPVLLIHGLGVNGSSWQLQMDPLVNAGFHPIAIDVPGFGKSRFSGRRWNISVVSDIIADFIKNKITVPCHLVGLSMGGALAQQLTLDHPEYFQKLVLVSTFSFLRPRKLIGWFYFLQRFMLVQVMGIGTQANFVAGRIFPGADQEILRTEMIRQINEADPHAYRAAMKSLAIFNSRKRLHEIKAPTLVISGEIDQTVPLSHQVELARWIPGAEQVVIPKAGHAASVEKFQEFNEILVDFLKKT